MRFILPPPSKSCIGLFLSFCLVLVLTSSCEKDPIQASFGPSPQNSISPSEVKASVIDGALHFASLEDFAEALKILPQASEKEVDLWGATEGFESWASEHRAIQNSIDQGSFTGLDENQKERFYIDKDGWLKTLAADRVLSEVMNTQGIVYVGGNLHHFHKENHIFIEQPTMEKFQVAQSTLQSDLDAGIKIFPQKVTEYWNDDLSGEAKEAKYFSCPFDNSGLYVWGHRKEETINGNKQRLVFDMHKAVYFFGGSSNEVFSYIAIDIENRRRSWGSWIRTYPNYEFGSLESGATSGEVNRWSVSQSLKVDRFIKANVRRASGTLVQQTLRQDQFVGMEPVGWSFEETRTSDADEYMIIDEVISTAFLGPGDEIETVAGDPYSFARGRISVNWLNRSTTMDVQLGCQ